MPTNLTYLLDEYEACENCRLIRKEKSLIGIPMGGPSRTTSSSMDAPPGGMMNRNLKKLLLIINCIMLATGISAGPLVMRLYYLYGGKSIWLSSWLETGGWPFMIPLLLVAYLRRRGADPSAQLFFMNLRLFSYACLVGLVAGTGDYLYAFGVKHIPVSTSSLILATQLAFTAGFAFLLVRQKFTAYSVNAVALLTFGAVVLALHSSSDRPEGVSNTSYYMGFFFTLLASAAFALMLPLVELIYKKAKQPVIYPLVMEIQLILSLSATIMCTVGMLVSGDYKTYPGEMKDYELGAGMYFLVLVCSAMVWQFFYLGAVGVIYYGSSLLSGIIIALALPVTEILAIIFYHEKFQVEKGVSLVLSLWGFVSYFYGEAKETKRQKKLKEKERENADSIGV